MTIAIANENMEVITLLDKETFAKDMYREHFNFSEVHHTLNNIWRGVWIKCLDGEEIFAFVFNS